MKANFEVKILPRIGDPSHGGEVAEGQHLHRIIKWDSKGFSWQADPKYAIQLDMSKGVETPASKDTGKVERNLDRPLGENEPKKFRQLAGTALYLSLDLRTIQYAVSRSGSEWNVKADQAAYASTEAIDPLLGEVSKGRVDL